MDARSCADIPTASHRSRHAASISRGSNANRRVRERSRSGASVSSETSRAPQSASRCSPANPRPPAVTHPIARIITRGAQPMGAVGAATSAWSPRSTDTATLAPPKPAASTVTRRGSLLRGFCCKRSMSGNAFRSTGRPSPAGTNPASAHASTASNSNAPAAPSGWPKRLFSAVTATRGRFAPNAVR